MPGQPCSSIPVVDVRPFINGFDKQAVSKEILDSFKSTGFVYLINHGLSEDKIRAMFEWSKKMFDQPMDVKMLAPHPESGAHHRGYSAPGREKVIQLDGSTDSGSNDNSRIARDIKESFEVGREDMNEMPNIWFPEGVLPGFKEACMDFYWACYEVEKVVLKALAVGFSLPEDYFLSYHSNADNQLRLLHYPSVEASVLNDPRASRIPSHTDFCSLTVRAEALDPPFVARTSLKKLSKLLMQDEIGGLEVEDPNFPGNFIAVPPIPGSIVVNAGDFLMRWSNDQIKSTVHRVRLPPSMRASVDDRSCIPSRYSIPYFCGANSDVTVDSIPGTWSPEYPKRYPPISARNYVMERLAANY